MCKGRKRPQLRSILYPGSKSHGDSFLYMKENIKVCINSFKSFAVREMMSLLQATSIQVGSWNKLRMSPDAESGRKRGLEARQERSRSDGWTFWHMCPGQALDYNDLLVLLKSCHVSLGPVILCLRVWPYLEVNILENCQMEDYVQEQIGILSGDLLSWNHSCR